MLRLAASRGGGPRNALGQVLRLAASRRGGAKPSAAPGSINPKCCAWQKGGRPETRSGTVHSLKCCPCQQKRVARLPSAAPGSIKRGARNALGHRPEPEVLPLPAETSREAPKCCAWQHQGGGPETRSGTVESLKCCPCQQKRAARLQSAAPGSIKGGGPETRLGTVQSLKCCPCQQKRAARLPSVCVV